MSTCNEALRALADKWDEAAAIQSTPAQGTDDVGDWSRGAAHVGHHCADELRAALASLSAPVAVEGMKCSDCGTVGMVLFQCVACSHGNYPPDTPSGTAGEAVGAVMVLRGNRHMSSATTPEQVAKFQKDNPAGWEFAGWLYTTPPTQAGTAGEAVACEHNWCDYVTPEYKKPPPFDLSESPVARYIDLGFMCDKCGATKPREAVDRTGLQIADLPHVWRRERVQTMNEQAHRELVDNNDLHMNNWCSGVAKGWSDAADALEKHMEACFLQPPNDVNLAWAAGCRHGRTTQAGTAGEAVYQWRPKDEGEAWFDADDAEFESMAFDPNVELRVLYTTPPSASSSAAADNEQSALAWMQRTAEALGVASRDDGLLCVAGALTGWIDKQRGKPSAAAGAVDEDAAFLAWFEKNQPGYLGSDSHQWRYARMGWNARAALNQPEGRAAAGAVDDLIEELEIVARQHDGLQSYGDACGPGMTARVCREAIAALTAHGEVRGDG